MYRDTNKKYKKEYVMFFSRKQISLFKIMKSFIKYQQIKI
jgi:hypothetical protein